MNDSIEDRESAREGPVTEAGDSSIIIDNTPKCTENPLSAGEKKRSGHRAGSSYTSKRPLIIDYV